MSVMEKWHTLNIEYALVSEVRHNSVRNKICNRNNIIDFGFSVAPADMK